MNTSLSGVYSGSLIGRRDAKGDERVRYLGLVVQGQPADVRGVPAEEEVAKVLAALEDRQYGPVHEQLDDGLATARAQRLVGRIRWQ